ncbi:Pectinesterase inhibitor [Corchorus capsularis]|uniref:Pectinesterase inhibitor n=1 Tax=Corchorus capsularis TaxID=210143 RepID=A0A1R3KWU5_COCAP|nr:Pectinesterase inhibitor [Corchorus capsularis]
MEVASTRISETLSFISQFQVNETDPTTQFYLKACVRKYIAGISLIEVNAIPAFDKKDFEEAYNDVALVRQLVAESECDDSRAVFIWEVCNLKQSCQQAEDALSQDMEKLQENVSVTVAGQPGDGSYIPQADHLRQETVQQMSRILTTRQAARGLLALGEYFQRLRALSTLWATRPREPA